MVLVLFKCVACSLVTLNVLCVVGQGVILVQMSDDGGLGDACSIMPTVQRLYSTPYNIQYIQ